jgi:hypothetical protein
VDRHRCRPQPDPGHRTVRRHPQPDPTHQPGDPLLGIGAAATARASAHGSEPVSTPPPLAQRDGNVLTPDWPRPSAPASGFDNFGPALVAYHVELSVRSVT